MHGENADVDISFNHKYLITFSLVFRGNTFQIHIHIYAHIMPSIYMCAASFCLVVCLCIDVVIEGGGERDLTSQLLG